MRWTTGSVSRASMGGRDGGGRTRRRGVDRLLFTGLRGCGWGLCGLCGGVARAPVPAPVTARFALKALSQVIYVPWEVDRDGGGRARRRGVDRLLFTWFRGCGWGHCGLCGG
eukprot:scaffold30553_cov91-Isochrysis_galbana.AAC.1